MSTPPQPRTTAPRALPRLDWEERARIREALRAYPAVHLEAPDLSPDDYVAWARTLGRPEVCLRPAFQVEGRPEIMVIGNVRDEQGRKRGGQALGQGFHSDMSWRPDAPELTCLYAREVPPTGGDTLFRSLYAMYEELDAGTLKAWAPLRVRHESGTDYFAGDERNGTERPLLGRHAETGRPLVFASPGYAARVIGLEREASDALLARLRESAIRAEVAHRWKGNDLLVWDNRAVLHSATPFDERHRRRLWRLSVALDAPPQPGPSGNEALRDRDG